MILESRGEEGVGSRPCSGEGGEQDLVGVELTSVAIVQHSFSLVLKERMVFLSLRKLVFLTKSSTHD